MEIGPLCRVVLLVRDVGRSLAFYAETLGLGTVVRRDGWAELETGPARICLRGPWPGMAFHEADFGRSPDEILFLVSDLDAAIRELRRRGAEIADPHVPGSGLRVAEMRDPDGRRVALEERGVRD